MPRLLEADAEFLTLNYDTLAPDKQAEAKDWLQRYKQQQADEGEPLFPSVVTRQVEQENNLRRMFEAPDKIDYDPGYTSSDPMHDKMQHANMALLASRYQKEPAEVASRYDFLLNDYARQKLGASEDVDTAKFYALAQKDMQKVKLREDTQREGMSAALRGEDGVKALAAWQAKNADRAKDDAGLFMRGYQQALEQDGEMLPIADRLLPLLEAQSAKKDGQAFDQTKAQELGNMIEQLAGMKKAQRKSVYRAIAARIEAAGYDQKGFWSQMLGELDKGLYRMEGTIGTSAGIASDVATAVAGAQTRIPDTFDGSSVSMPVLSDEEQQALLRQRDYRQRIGNVQQEIMQIVSGELDPVRPTLGWLNDTIETGAIKGPGAVAPFMAASALLGPYGAGLVFTADFAEQNRRELVQSGLDDEQAQKIAVMAAPLQAAVESLSNMVSLGKFPAVQSVLSRFTRPVGGASLVGRYVQNSLISLATEFTEEQVQDNVLVPAMQELLGALEKDVPDVDWSFYKTRAANATPELAATLLPMALVFGGVMTAADARLSDRMTSNVDALTALNYSQAQATEIVQEKTPEARIAKAASLWRSREGNKTSLEQGAAKLAERLKALSGDAVAYQAELERRGVLPRVMHTAENDWLLTFNDGSTARFGTHDEASTARWTWAEDQLGRVHALTREALTSMERNMSTNRELGVEFKPDVRTAQDAVNEGASVEQIKNRVEQGKVLGDIDPNEAFDTALMVDRATAEADGFLSSYQILGSSRNEFKDGVLRTTIRLWEGANVLTLVEEKLEGDAKAIVASRGGRGWMLAALRNYEQESGDKLFREVPDDQLTDDDLVEAWSHLGPSYLVERSSFGEPLQQNNMRRFSRLLMRAGLAGALNSESTFWQAVVNRAQKLRELKAAGKLGADVVAELEKQLGIDSQVKHEQESLPVIQQVANEVAQQASDWVDDSQFDNLPPSSDTFSMASASGAAQANEPSPGGLSEAEARNPMTIYRAGDADEVGVKPWASFTPERSVAEAYTDNPGFGGDTVRELRIDAGNVLDLTSGNKFKKLAEALGLEGQEAIDKADEWHSNGWNYPWEESSKVKRALEDSDFDAVQYTDDFPAGATTIIFTRTPSQIDTSFESSRAAGGTTSGYSEANPGPNGETFSTSRAIPADASKVVQMPDGARLVGPTTFSIRAYHGTPHKVDKFSLSKIGTGEGAQAYGWGLYFAESRDVGEQYRKQLTGVFKTGNDQLDTRLVTTGGDLDKAIAELQNMANASPESRRSLWTDAIETAQKLKEAGGLPDKGGNLYTVELLPDQADFLDWDKPLSEQSEKVKAAIENAEWDGPKDRYENGKFIGDVENALAYSKRRGEAMNGADLYRVIVSAMRPKAGAGIAEMQKASQKLASLGIPGIRYLDGGSRGAGDGTRNYVIFDENLIRILEENGKPVETFSLGKVTPAQDAEYMAAVEAGDMETAQRMVDEAAFDQPGLSSEDVQRLIDLNSPNMALNYRAIAKALGGKKYVLEKIPVGTLKFEEGSENVVDAKRANPSKGPIIIGVDGVIVDGRHRAMLAKQNKQETILAYVPQNTSTVTYDSAGNVIPLSQRFNPADDRITYSLRPGDFASRVEAMFSPFQRSPEARLVMARVAKDRALRLGNELIEKANVIRTMGSIDREARVRAALAEDKAVQDYLDSLTPQARQTLEWQPADLQDDPLVSAMLDFGKLMSKTTALQRGKLDLKMGDFDGAPWLPPSFYSKGAGIMPDQMAQAMFDAGLLPDAYTDTLWAELSKRIEATRKDKAAHREAVQAFKDAKKAARDAAAKEAGTWADNAKKQAGSAKAQRDRIKAWLRVLDGILAASPPEVRARVGGFVKMAGIATDEAALRYLEDRVAKLGKELEKYLVKQARGQLERIFDKARPKSDAGEKAKGKLTPELHAWFKLAEEAAKLSPAVADERIQGIEQSLASDMTDAIKQELSDWLGRPVTDDAEAQTWQETRLTLFQTFGAVMYGTDAKSERNAAEITAALDAAREAYQTGRLAHIEQLAKLREKRAEERGDGIQRVGSPYDPNKANTRKKALNKATGLKGRALDYMDTGLDASGFFLDLLGDDTTTDLYETTRRNLLEAAATKADNMDKRKADFAAMLKQVFPGKGLVDRLRGLWELQQIQENAPVGTMSQLQAMQFTLWHLDPDSREWLATNGYGDEWQAKAEQWLTAEAKAVRAWLLKQYDGQYDRLNPVFRRLRGVNLPRVEVYGGKRQIEHSKSDSTASIEADMMRGGMDAGFTKTRVSRPTGRPRMTDALQNYWQNALQVEHYIAFAETVTELKAVFGHRDFLGAVETNRGLAKKQQVLDWISNIETAGTRDAFAHSMQGKLFGRYGKAVSASALLFKLATLAKQAPAAIQSAFKVGLKEYFTSLSRILAGKGAISLGDMYRSDTVQRRLSGHDNEMLQASKGWNQRHFENEILDKAAIASEVMMNAGWYEMGWTDARFTTISAAVAYDVAFRDGKKLGMTDDEAKAFAANQADLIVMETAQPQDVVTKSLAENMMPQALLRLVFAFQSANRQVFGLTYLAAKRGKVANAYAVAAIIAAMTQTIGGIMRMLFSDDDPEELFDPQAYALGMATAPLTGMVGLGPLVEFGLNFAGVESRFSPSSAAAAKSLQDIVNGEADTKDVGRVVSMAGAALGGRGAMLSVGWNVLNQIMGLYENVTANE